MPSPCTVVFASNNAGVVPLSMSLWSLLRHAAAETCYDVRVLSDGIAEDEKKRLTDIALSLSPRHSLSFIEMDTLFREMESRWGDVINQCPDWPRAAWARITIPELMPEVKRVLYLDIDILVCDDCSPLFTTDMQGAALGAVYEQVSAPGSFFNDKFDMPLSYPGYFNSGVLVMDLDVFRRDQLGDLVMQTAIRFKEQLTMPDQDALNAALYDRIFRLHPRWNWNDVTTRRFRSYRDGSRKLYRAAEPREVIEASLYPGIVHYAGRFKPWKPNYHIMRHLYEDAVKESGLPGFRIGEGWGLKIKLKNWLYKPLDALLWRKIRRLAKRYGITPEPRVATWGLSSQLAKSGWPPADR